MHIVNMIFKTCNDYLLVSGQRKSVWEPKVHANFLNPRWLCVLYTFLSVLVKERKGKEKEEKGKGEESVRERAEGVKEGSIENLA